MLKLKILMATFLSTVLGCSFELGHTLIPIQIEQVLNWQYNPENRELKIDIYTLAPNGVNYNLNSEIIQKDELITISCSAKILGPGSHGLGPISSVIAKDIIADRKYRVVDGVSGSLVREIIPTAVPEHLKSILEGGWRSRRL